MDAGTGEIVVRLLTDNAADDAGQVPALLEGLEGEIASVAADGAYDGEPVYQAIAGHQPDPPPDVVIPPRRGGPGPRARHRAGERGGTITSASGCRAATSA